MVGGFVVAQALRNFKTGTILEYMIKGFFPRFLCVLYYSWAVVDYI